MVIGDNIDIWIWRGSEATWTTKNGGTELLHVLEKEWPNLNIDRWFVYDVGNGHSARLWEDFCSWNTQGANSPSLYDVTTDQNITLAQVKDRLGCLVAQSGLGNGLTL
uniref:Uncharacterized protein n=1 Tax=Utricularia reniformis TaxID=192314 RepID=A0A1Y0AZ14_9LAMI|nr:hypothetical protein AEK19_MT1537 [Utricularia reniformis]ART30387.1 hypothetical protein AEK19_MT1537 [Utricularia reniformis]